MAYQTGTATGIADLLDKLGTFSAANGWTQHRRDANSLSISKGAVFQNYFDNTSEIWMKGATGFSSAAAWDAQPGADTNTQKSRHMPGSFAAYHFFAANDYLHVVVEVDPGLYRHLNAGEIAKSSAYTGGQYSACVSMAATGEFRSGLFGNILSGSFSEYVETPALKLNFDGFDAWRHFTGDALSSGSPPYVRSSDHMGGAAPVQYQWFIDWYNKCTPNTLNGLSVFAPIYLFVDRASSMMSPLGYVRDLRTLNISAFDPGQTVTIGADQWLIFPASAKGSGTYGTGNFGYAYKKIP